MQHLEDGFLHALADGEIPSEELTAVREHLEQCEPCRVRLDEARMEAETARELIELIEVPALVPAEQRSGVAVEALDRRTDRPTDRRWIRTLAWAATVVLAAGVGYYGRGSAPFAAPAADPMSVAAKLDTVFLDIPAEGQARENEDQRNATPALSQPKQVPADPAPPERQEAAGFRQESDSAQKRRVAEQSSRLDEVAAASAPSAQRKAAPSEADAKKEKEAESKLTVSARERALVDSRDQVAAGNLARKAAAPPAPVASVAEERALGKTAADAAGVVVTFPRAVELLGGRIKLIEGMVPVRLEATGRVVRVIYTIDEGEIVLAQVSGADSLNWNVSGPLGADSLAQLRRRVR